MITVTVYDYTTPTDDSIPAGDNVTVYPQLSTVLSIRDIGTYMVTLPYMVHLPYMETVTIYGNTGPCYYIR